MKRQLLAIGISVLLPLTGAAVVVVATAAEAAVLGVRRLVAM